MDTSLRVWMLYVNLNPNVNPNPNPNVNKLFLEYVYSSDNEKLLIMVFENNTDKVQIIKKDFSFID